MATGTDEVKALQTSLNQKGAGLKVDGIYGKLTAAAAAKYNSPATTSPTINPINPAPGAAPSSADALVSSLQQKLLEQSGVVSSTNSQLETRLNEAISGVKSSTESANKALESSYGRELGYLQEDAASALTAGRAGGAGGILNMAALRELTQTTDKSLKDLETRKQELILQNNAQGAAKIAEMQLTAIEFQQKAQQQVFSNLLGIAGFATQLQSNELAKNNQTFQQSAAMSTIALQYGIDIRPGDTLASVTTRAMPFASKEQQLSMAKLQADINKSNAEAAKYIREGVNSQTYSSGDLDTMALAYLNSPDKNNFFGKDIDTSKKSIIINKAAEISAGNSSIKYTQNSKTKAEALSKVYADTSLTPTDQVLVSAFIEKNFVPPTETNKTKTSTPGLPGLVVGGAKGGLNLSSALSEWLLGQEKGTFPRY